MATFEDLTPYTYLRPEKEAPGTVNIGWLESDRPFPTGETSAEFRDKLRQICRIRVNQTRGFHRCPFCPDDSGHVSSAEVRVAHGGRVYAAPTLVQHYVEAHSYRPPDEFVAAVLAWTPVAKPDPPPVWWMRLFAVLVFPVVCVVMLPLAVLAVVSIPFFALYPDRHAHRFDYGDERQQALMMRYRRYAARVSFWRRCGRAITFPFGRASSPLGR